jgi:hypothetical protein
MNYNLSDKTEAKSAYDRLRYLTKKGKRVAVTEIREKRSLNQNSYLHLLLGAFGMNFGYTIEESKLIYKSVNKPLYYYNKKGLQFSRSSADLDTKEMTESIDRFKEYSEEHGFKLPPATDQGWLLSIENEIERNRRYL